MYVNNSNLRPIMPRFLGIGLGLLVGSAIQVPQLQLQLQYRSSFRCQQPLFNALVRGELLN